MRKTIFFFISVFFLKSCSAPGSAFLGPTFTGVKTGSVYQTSLSYGSGKAVNSIKEVLKNENKISNNLSLKKNDTKIQTNIFQNPPILVTLKTYRIKISKLIDDEPLPWHIIIKDCW